MESVCVASLQFTYEHELDHICVCCHLCNPHVTMNRMASVCAASLQFTCECEFDGIYVYRMYIL